MRILVIDPGSTSTKVGVFEEERLVLRRTIAHDRAIVDSFEDLLDQEPMRVSAVAGLLADEGYLARRVASHAQFNGMNMLTGRFARFTGENIVMASMWLHIGANMDQRERLYIGTMTAQGLGLQNPNGPAHTATFISISSPDRANMVIGMVDEALKLVNKQRADMGAYQNRLEYAMKGLAVGAENLQASESRIRDTDMAEQMVSFVKNQILIQSSMSMLAQANVKPQTVLELMRWSEE